MRRFETGDEDIAQDDPGLERPPERGLGQEPRPRSTPSEEGSQRHHGLSLLLVPLHQPGVTVRPIRQMTGGAEFNEVFFAGARTEGSLHLGPVGEGWKVAMATLGFERGTAFLSQQRMFERELDDILEEAHKRGATDDPVLRDALVGHWVGLQIMKYNGLRMLTSLVQKGVLGPESSIGKLYWSNWHRNLGETAMEVLGADLKNGLLSIDLVRPQAERIVKSIAISEQE